tara:strand:- start:3369 stop:3935 length:567 start_codon:yes stop_codon:yes gene_type:complete
MSVRSVDRFLPDRVGANLQVTDEHDLSTMFLTIGLLHNETFGNRRYTGIYTYISYKAFLDRDLTGTENGVPKCITDKLSLTFSKSPQFNIVSAGPLRANKLSRDESEFEVSGPHGDVRKGYFLVIKRPRRRMPFGRLQAVKFYTTDVNMLSARDERTPNNVPVNTNIFEYCKVFRTILVKDESYCVVM